MNNNFNNSIQRRHSKNYRPSRPRKTDSSAQSSPAIGYETHKSLPVVECIFESQRRVQLPAPFSEGVPKTSVYNVRLKLRSPPDVLSNSELRAGLWQVTPNYSRQSDKSWKYEALSVSDEEILVRKVKFRDCSYTLRHCCFVIGIYSVITRRLVCVSPKFKVLARKRKRGSPKPRIRQRHFKTTIVSDYMKINTALFVENVTSPMEDRKLNAKYTSLHRYPSVSSTDSTNTNYGYQPQPQSQPQPQPQPHHNYLSSHHPLPPPPISHHVSESQPRRAPSNCVYTVLPAHADHFQQSHHGISSHSVPPEYATNEPQDNSLHVHSLPAKKVQAFRPSNYSAFRPLVTEPRKTIVYDNPENEI